MLIDSHPRKTKILVGHKKQVNTFQDMYIKDKLHHSWLLEGPSGVGKATFAYTISRAILSNNIQNKNISLFNKDTKNNTLEIEYSDKNRFVL